MRIGVLAVQGAFIEHEKVLQRLDVDCFEIRKKADLERDMNGIILPGGESTVMRKLLNDLGLFDEIKERILAGLPVLGTCAGAILLAEQIEGCNEVCFGTIPMKIRRNAYGRQLGSFSVEQNIEGIGIFQMRFIRAPYIVSAKPEVKVLSRVDDKIVAVEYQNQIALSFHPELTEDNRLHKFFINKCYRVGK